MFLDLAKKARTIRRFDVSKSLDKEKLLSVLECVRLVASAGNLQRIRYLTLSGEEAPGAFKKVKLGGYLPDDKKPDVSVAPTAYIILATEREEPDLSLAIDVGISAEAIVLYAAELGIGACIVRNFDKDYFTDLTIKYGYHPFLVIALGYPSETAEIISASGTENLKYFKNEEGINCVPKLDLNELILNK